MLSILAVVLVLLSLAGSASAYTCTYYTTYQDGKTLYCKQCCSASGQLCWVDCS